MRTPARCGAWVLPLLLTGCIFHKIRTTPLQPLAPPLEASLPLDVASLELPPSIEVIPAKPIYNLRVPSEPIKQAAKHKRLSNKSAEETSEAAANLSPAAPAIGEALFLSDPANFRQQTEVSIESIERGLNGINRTLDDSEQKTADHIREFLKQAKAALASGDIDGAHTLAAKAKVLLDELTKS